MKQPTFTQRFICKHVPTDCDHSFRWILCRVLAIQYVCPPACGRPANSKPQHGKAMPKSRLQWIMPKIKQALSALWPGLSQLPVKPSHRHLCLRLKNERPKVQNHTCLVSLRQATCSHELFLLTVKENQCTSLGRPTPKRRTN